MVRESYTLSLLATVATMVSAQNLVPTAGSSSFPACAVGCQVLMQAQSVCTPPTAVTSTQLIYDNCFCQTPSLVDLYTTGETLCTSQCSTTSDRQLLSTWFINFCKAVGSGVDPVSGGSATTLTTSTTATASSTTEPTKAASTYVVGLPSDDTRPWIKSHWQWIVMLIFLFFGLLGIGLGAKWAKKRHDLKVQQNKAARSGFPDPGGKNTARDNALSPDPWTPHQHMTTSNGYHSSPNGGLQTINEDKDGSSKGSSKRISRIEVTEIQPVSPPVHTRGLDKSSSPV